MMTTLDLDDDIYEYSKTLERLQEENLALKRTLRRFMLFSVPGQINSNLQDGDLKTHLHEAEMLFDNMFGTLQVPAFAGDIIHTDGGDVSDFVFTKVNAAFAGYFHMEPKDIIGKTNRSLNLLKSEYWLDSIASTCKTLDPSNIKIVQGDDTLNATVFSIKHESFVAHFVSNYSGMGVKTLEEFHNLKFSQMLVNALPTPLFYKDMDGRYVLCNQSYAKYILGVSHDDIVGKTGKELDGFVPKEYAGFYQEKDIELMKSNGVQSYEGPIKCSDGVVREFIINRTLVKDSRGEFAGILGVMQDVDNMIKARRELADSENRYKALFNGISQPTLVVDADGNIILLNKSAVELFDNSDNTFIDNLPSDEPADKLVSREHIRQVYDSGISMQYKVSVMINGIERWYLCNMQLIHDFFGEKVVQVICNDITELTHYQAELLEQKQRVEGSNKLKTVFLSNIAHETRTPLNIIGGLVQLLQSGINQDKHQEYLASIFSNCRKLLDIIDDIVELSNIEAGQVKIRHEMCSINNIVEVAFVCLGDTLKASGKTGIRISHSDSIDEYKALVYADSSFINQAFKKLISNAVTFTNEGEISIGAEIDDDTYITFYVKDTGIGIPHDKLNVIFERFRQVDEGASRSYGGTGLGLPIVNELVKSMNGTVHVESHENEGSIFRFTIPYERAGIK